MHSHYKPPAIAHKPLTAEEIEQLRQGRSDLVAMQRALHLNDFALANELELRALKGNEDLRPKRPGWPSFSDLKSHEAIVSPTGKLSGLKFHNEVETSDCEWCGGWGEFDVEASNGRSMTFTCPECDGSGQGETESHPLTLEVQTDLAGYIKKITYLDPDDHRYEFLEPHTEPENVL